MVSFYLFQDFLRAWFTGTLHHPNLWHSVTDGHFLLRAGSQISNPAGGKSCYCQFPGLCNIMNINLSRAKRRAPFQPSFRALTWHAWCLETKYLPLTPSVSRQRDEEVFQGLKRKALSCLDCRPFLPRKVVYRSLWLFRSSLPVVKDCVHVVLWLSKTGYWCPDSVVRHPALLSLTVHSALFSHKIVEIKHMSLHTIILVSKVLSLA